MKWLTFLKSRLIAIGLAVIGVLAALLTFSGYRRKQAENAKKVYKKQAEEYWEILDRDAELEADFDRDIKDLDDAAAARDYLRDLNDGWLRDRED